MSVGRLPGGEQPVVVLGPTHHTRLFLLEVDPEEVGLVAPRQKKGLLEGGRVNAGLLPVSLK